ncbi:XRE family transcriptional regulator [Janibacter sp. LM]|uniref:XRE family transcriptional regulator n=1 Tax=Janibacter sp. LM TaxID=3144845 RepID=UPI0031F68279
MSTAGKTYVDLAERIEVDPKTVERWVTLSRVPHRRNRVQIAALLGEDEHFLWPEVASDPRSVKATESELAHLYPNRGAVPIDTWVHLLESATSQIDLWAFAGSFLHDAIPDFGGLLTSAARRGVRVRLLFGDPASRSVAERGEEEGIGDLLASRCRLTWNYLSPVLATPGIEARAHDVTVYASIFRFDDNALVNPHALGSPASHSPVLHIRKLDGGRLFDHYIASFERGWSGGRRHSAE